MSFRDEPEQDSVRVETPWSEVYPEGRAAVGDGKGRFG